MGLNLDFCRSQTPLTDEEREGLLVPTISNRGELDEFEQLNVEQAVEWTFGHKLKQERIFSETFIRELHRRMYDQVWKWAGNYRTTNKNIGIDKYQIPTEVRKLIDDAIYWHKNDTYSADELAIRFKHRLVSIHPFANGNGRHSRLLADVIASHIYHQPVFTWGRAGLVKPGEARKTYIAALHAADNGDIEPLLVFARS